MKNCIWLTFFIIISCQNNTEKTTLFNTVCNPVNLSYAFCPDEPSRRDEAYPRVVLFGGEYYLFTSQPGGYFHSTDLIRWSFITTTDLSAEAHTPTVVNIENELYYMASYQTSIYKTTNPRSGKWEVATNTFPYPVAEPMFFHDEDKKLYLYTGAGASVSLMGVEIDPATLLPVGETVSLIGSCKEKHGWEIPGDYHTWLDSTPWIEGTWINKHNSKYYLQYTTPGIYLKSSNAGVYVSDNPLGPFALAKHNPFAYKPEGFTTGAGHGCTFQDKYGNYWYMGTTAVTSKHIFERRLSLYPVFFDTDGEMYAYTTLGDYPMIIPDKKVSSPEELFPGWMLLSYNKKATCSSKLRGYPACSATNEDIRSWWSAETRNEGEYIAVDLGEQCEVKAIQLNFADHDAKLSGRGDSTYYQYYIEVSKDGKSWNKLIDKSLNTQNEPHDYIQLKKGVKTRHIRVKNIYFPSGKFSTSGLRVFGKANKASPQEAVFTRITRNEKDRRSVKLKWNEVEEAIGYNIRFGTHPDKLYNSYIIYDDTEFELNCLHTERTYFFVIDSFNEGGVTQGSKPEEVF